LICGPGQLTHALAVASDNLLLSLGVVDGRNIWRSDLDRALETIRMAAERLGSERVQVVPSCSLLHVPVDLETERQLDPAIKTWPPKIRRNSRGDWRRTVRFSPGVTATGEPATQRYVRARRRSNR